MTYDAFESYGTVAAPVIPDNRANRQKKNPSALDLKMEERQRLSRAYRISKRAERIAILQEEPRLFDFLRYLRKVGPDDGDELLEDVKSCDWMLSASQQIRGFALSLIARRQDKIRLALGLVPFDDPLPPDTNVFFEAQKLLRTGGPL